MSEYSLGFSGKLLDAARAVIGNGLDSVDAARTVLYLSSLASEIALKALLERAGKPVQEIKKRQHDLCALLKDIGKCEVLVEIGARSRWVSASRVRAVTVDERYADATVGKILTGEERGTSRYPNELRYGNRFRDYPPELRLGAAIALVKWAHENSSKIRFVSRMQVTRPKGVI